MNSSIARKASSAQLNEYVEIYSRRLQMPETTGEIKKQVQRSLKVVKDELNRRERNRVNF